MRESDIEPLRKMHELSGFAYTLDLDGPHVECVLVVTGDDDQPIAAAIAERILQVGLLSAEMKPAAKMAAIRLLHHHMAAALRALGWNEANSFLPPQVAEKFGRRLAKSFGWVKQWESFAIWF